MTARDDLRLPPPPAEPARRSRLPLAAKVPEIALIFWAIKLVTTGIGESAADYMGSTNTTVSNIVAIGGIIIALILQFRAPRYRATIYWFAVLMVAVFGTQVADGLRNDLSLSYGVTTPIFAAITALVFVLWYRSEGTLSIHSIISRRRETYYWCAVLATFSLGTAAGDLTAATLNFGYWWSAVLFAGLMAIPAVAWWQFGLNPIVAFWTCYALTRPLGASIADGLGKPVPQSGLGWGDGPVTAAGLVLFAGLVLYVAISKRDIQDPATGEAFVPSAVHAHTHEHSSGHAATGAAQPVEQGEL